VDAERKKRIIKYLIYLISNPDKSNIQDFKVEKKKKGMDQIITIYLKKNQLRES